MNKHSCFTNIEKIQYVSRVHGISSLHNCPNVTLVKMSYQLLSLNPGYIYQGT